MPLHSSIPYKLCLTFHLKFLCLQQTKKQEALLGTLYISHAHCIAAGVAVVPVFDDTDLCLHKCADPADDPGELELVRAS